MARIANARPDPNRDFTHSNDFSSQNDSSRTLIAHRGLFFKPLPNNEFAAENTYTAYTWAACQGYAGVEIDLRVTQDGDLIMMHDSSPMRTTTIGRHPHFTPSVKPEDLAEFITPGRINSPYSREEGIGDSNEGVTISNILLDNFLSIRMDDFGQFRNAVTYNSPSEILFEGFLAKVQEQGNIDPIKNTVLILDIQSYDVYQRAMQIVRDHNAWNRVIFKVWTEAIPVEFAPHELHSYLTPRLNWDVLERSMGITSANKVKQNLVVAFNGLVMRPENPNQPDNYQLKFFNTEVAHDNGITLEMLTDKHNLYSQTPQAEIYDVYIDPYEEIEPYMEIEFIEQFVYGDIFGVGTVSNVFNLMGVEALLFDGMTHSDQWIQNNRQLNLQNYSGVLPWGVYRSPDYIRRVPLHTHDDHEECNTSSDSAECHRATSAAPANCYSVNSIRMNDFYKSRLVYTAINPDHQDVRINWAQQAAVVTADIPQHIYSRELCSDSTHSNDSH
ncbi:glycerophosphodiester phosphodiesterase family protein [Woodsholea maritima]|uniref:glycerophosphodiester phosphodiesterase family protein n=1 Tax=Woodsholea maritima TaxID=240237 RepID=UPI0014613918|nr:glycerophosphodiester phosphodiesterase family protein [Woodsholea maritima]